MNGHFVSQHFVNYLREYFENTDTYNNQNNNDTKWLYNKLIENKYDIIKKAYLKGECSLFTQKFECGFSGCTAVTIIMVGDKIICANAGDSRAIMIECNKNSSVSNF